MTRLDEFAPVWQFHEVHRITVQSTADRVYGAIRAVTAREIRFFRALTWLRRLGRSGPESILSAPADLPILEVAARTGFLLLAASPPTSGPASPPGPLSTSWRGGMIGEIVVGTVLIAPPGAEQPRSPEEFKTLDGPGYAKATMNFLIQPSDSGACVVTTETRVCATDARARRRFALYWWAIRPGSGLIRRMWLRAIKRRAE